MVTYGEITFRVLIEEETFLAPDLDDRFCELEAKLDEWLADEMETEFPEFNFIRD